MTSLPPWAADPGSLTLTEAQYDGLPDHVRKLIEVIDGNVIFCPSGTPEHRAVTCALADRRTLMHGVGRPDDRSGVGRQVLLGRCRVRSCLDAARSQEQVRVEVLVGGGTCSVPLACCLPGEPPPRG